MSFFLGIWRRIGAKLYMALGFAVLLTLVSSAVGVYYFEQSGDTNYQVRTESVPVLEASWAAIAEGERLRNQGIRATTEAIAQDQVNMTLDDLESQLSVVAIVPSLAGLATQAQDRAYTLTETMDNLALTQQAKQDADAAAGELRSRLLAGDDGLVILSLTEMLGAGSLQELDNVWQQFSRTPSLDAESAELGQQIFEVRGQQLTLEGRVGELSAELDFNGQALEVSLAELLNAAQANSTQALESSVARFDQGRILLAVISLVSVGAATFTAWLLVGNGLVRPLTRLSERMRGMAAGDLETPVPGVGKDEIGDLAHALEVFREQALEVQRLNLVEKLYGELQEANAELQRMQDRLVAQEKLAALGELVSGVAHEISNPLNFVQNFAEVSVEMYEELAEVLNTYRDTMSEEDRAAIDELEEDLADSLGRIRTNGGRALAIVERMRGLGVVGGELVPVEVNSTVYSAVEVAKDAFLAQWPDLKLSVHYELDPDVGEVSLVEHDFGEAVVNLVSNACYAMWLRQSAGNDQSYQPLLNVTSAAGDDFIEIRVRDNGTGIADDVVGHIFNPFFSTREGALGAGLGLSIAADVIRRSGGNLTMETVYGEYAEFTISLPLEEAATEAVGAEPAFS